MWLYEVAEVIQKVLQEKGRDIVLKSIKPAVDGIVFETTYETFIKWFRVDGHIEEHHKGAWRK